MSDCPFRKELSDYLLNLDVIDDRMHELEPILGYRFRDIRNLSNAMCAIKLDRPDSGDNSKDYYNDSLAVVGDCVLKTVLSEELFRRGLFKGDLTEIKKMLEGNKALLEMSDKMGLSAFAYNEHGFYPNLESQDRPPYSKHNQYLEAIIGSVFFDSDYSTCKSWLLRRFYTKDVIDDWIDRYNNRIKL